MHDKRVNLILYMSFFLSGVAGLIYEVLWARYLSLIFGNTAYAHSLVLATFMGGLALGRKKTEAGESYQLREAQIPYGDDFGAKKIEIAPENACFWD